MATKIKAARAPGLDPRPEPPDSAPVGADAIGPLPLLPESLTCFEATEELDPDALLADAAGRGRRRAAPRPSDNPFGNPIQLLALTLGRRLDAGALSLAAIEQLVQRLTVAVLPAPRRRGSGAISARATRRQSGDAPAPDRAPGAGARASAVPFETFRRRVEGERFGIVITAHPTFALARELRVLLTELAIDRRPAAGDRAGAPRRGRPARAPPRPARSISPRSTASRSTRWSTCMPRCTRSTTWCSRSPRSSTPSAGPSSARAW